MITTKDNVIAIELGHGDVAVGFNGRDGKPCIEFKQLTANYNIGIDALKLEVDTEVPSVYITVPNKESLAVLEKAFEALKEAV